MKKNIAILMGGYSDEHAISIKSGNVVYKHLDQNLYNTFRIVIDKVDWYYWSDTDEKIAVNRADFSVTINGNQVVFDAVFNTVHGTPGEDGLIQAYLQLLGIPQTSCDFYSSAITFNKRDCISILKSYNIPVAQNYLINQGDPLDVDQIVSKVGLPCFIKANRSGSSFGVEKAYGVADIIPALEKAFIVDNEVIIESFLSGVEVSVGVVNIDGGIQVLGITEIVSENDFFDYEAKYLGKSQEITPARISDEQAEQVSDLALKVYKILNMRGLSRTDFIFHEGKPYFLEINTNPGLSEASILPQQSLEKGVALETLFGSQVEQCF